MDAVIVFFWAVFAVVGYLIGQPKGRPVGGLVLGVLLGPLGWLLVAVGPNFRKQNTAPPLPPSVPPPLPISKLRVAKDGTDLGEIDLPSVKLHLKTGLLTQSDYYYDPNQSDWVTLELCPELESYWRQVLTHAASA